MDGFHISFYKVALVVLLMVNKLKVHRSIICIPDVALLFLAREDFFIDIKIQVFHVHSIGNHMVDELDKGNPILDCSGD